MADIIKATIKCYVTNLFIRILEQMSRLFQFFISDIAGRRIIVYPFELALKRRQTHII